MRLGYQQEVVTLAEIFVQGIDPCSYTDWCGVLQWRNAYMRILNHLHNGDEDMKISLST